MNAGASILDPACVSIGDMVVTLSIARGEVVEIGQFASGRHFVIVRSRDMNYRVMLDKIAQVERDGVLIWQSS